jgi:hypothetical protein
MRALGLLMVVWSTGCYSTGVLAPQTLRSLGTGLSGPRLVGDHHGSALVEPGAMVRARLSDGGHSGWFEAGGLRVSPEGLKLGDPLRLAEVSAVMVSDLDEREVQLLHETAPAGASVQHWRFSTDYRLRAPAAEAVDWARRYAARAVAEGKAGGTFRLSRGNRLIDDPPPVTVRNLVEATGPTAAFGPGLRWQEIEALEVRAFDPLLSAMTVPLFPFVLLGVALDEDHANRAMSSTEGDGEGYHPTLTWNDPAGEPLFTGRARRRAIVQPLATADVQTSWSGDAAAGATVGLRFCNFYELGVVTRALSLRAARADGSRANALAFGALLGLHIDPAADGRYAFALGVEIVGARAPVAATQVELAWGPRFGLPRGLFLTVSPLNVAGLNLAGKTEVRFVSSLQLGGTL